MVQLLHKLKIRAVNGPHVLMKVIKNPVTQHLPAGSRKYVTSCKGKIVNMHDFVKTLPQDEPVVFAFGQMSHGTIENDTPTNPNTWSSVDMEWSKIKAFQG